MEPLPPFEQLSTPFGAKDRPHAWGIERFFLLDNPLVPAPAWRNTHGVPHDALCYHVTVFDPLGKVGYAVSIMGYEVGGTAPPSAPKFHIVEESSTVVLLAVQRQVRHKDTPVYLEARWHPEYGESLEIKGLEQDPRQASVLKMHRGISLLKSIEALGRPLGSLYYSTREAFFEACRANWNIAKRRYNRPTAAHLIVLLPIERTAYYNHVHTYGQPPLA